MAVTDSSGADEGFEPVYVELDWYDGPQAGVAAVHGVPHYFRCIHDQPPGRDLDDEFLVWQADQQALAWEREQWVIFTEWNERHDAGTVGADSHPGHGGVDERYDELNELLAPYRDAPAGARRMKAEFHFLDRIQRYHADGPDYTLRWRPMVCPSGGGES